MRKQITRRIFDWKAKNVSSHKTGTLIHLGIEERMTKERVVLIGWFWLAIALLVHLLHIHHLSGASNMSNNSLTQWHSNLGQIFFRSAVLLEHLGHQFGMLLVQKEQGTAENVNKIIVFHGFCRTHISACTSAFASCKCTGGR